MFWNKTLAVVASLGLCLGLAGLTPAVADIHDVVNGKAGVQAESVSGSIKSVDHAYSTFTLTAADGTETIFTYDGNTKYLINGEAATHDQVLVMANQVDVEHQNNLALVVKLAGGAAEVEAETEVEVEIEAESDIEIEAEADDGLESEALPIE